MSPWKSCPHFFVSNLGQSGESNPNRLTHYGGEDHEDQDEGGGDDDQQVKIVPRPICVQRSSSTWFICHVRAPETVLLKRLSDINWPIILILRNIKLTNQQMMLSPTHLQLWPSNHQDL